MANDQMLQLLAGQLGQTLSPDPTVRRSAEKELAAFEGNSGFSLLLLHLVSSAEAQADIRAAAAITFKNFVKRNWATVDGDAGKISVGDRQLIKQHIVELMLQVPSKLQQQLSEAVSIIGAQDYPDNWQELLPTLVQKLASNDFSIINGVLQTANSLFKKYTYEFKSDPLYAEIKYSLDNFADPLTQLTKTIIGSLAQFANDRQTLLLLFTLLQEIVEIFYSLNFQEFPEYFEDHLAEWMEMFHTILTYDNPLVKSDDDERPGPFEKTKAQICENIALYASKYDDEDTEIKTHLPMFVQDIWNLLCTTGREVKNDYLVSGAIQFLSSVASRPRTSTLFAAEGVLNTICQNIIIPNMQLREEDVECFEDDPEEYMRRDIEGSDTESRRRAACDLVRALRVHFEAQVTPIFTAYVNAMLQEYAQNPNAHWKSKDAAIFLITSLTVTSTVQTLGTTKTNTLVNVDEFFISHIVPDLQAQNTNALPVLKADAIKYVLTFRNQLAREALLATVPILITHIGAESLVQHSYAANVLERLLTIKDPPGASNRDAKLKIGREDIKPHLESALTALFGALARPQSVENHYVMKCIMRIICVAKEDIVPYAGVIVQQLTVKLMEVAKNPRKPEFNHFLFESIGASVRFVCQVNPAAVEAFEAQLFPPFELILQEDVTEFMPYVFQIMAQLLEARQPPTPPQYQALFPHLMSPLLWEKTGNVPALTRLVQAFILKGGQIIGPDANIMNALLGVFQKLISSKTNDHHGFAVLDSIIECVPKQYYEQYLKPIFMILFQRLQAAKTAKYVKGLLGFVALLMAKHGPDQAIAVVDSIQPQLFGMVINSLYVPDLQKVSGPIERKTCAVGITACLTQSQTMLSTYRQQWPALLNSLVALFELPEDDRDDDLDFLDVDAQSGYQNAYSRLVFSGKAEHDPFANISDPRANLATSLAQLASKLGPGGVPGLLKLADPTAVSHISRYAQAAGVTLA
eukprot:comp24082_c0_seq1/m.43377 comp24082_c0_seq1/g.43377  ORF comp24082_c0_seq1/g.43377 comp24082_c0_seq1/m.43377 type:complete len:977 (-) comp24082_c0_seq1:650-3580(-)